MDEGESVLTRRIAAMLAGGALGAAALAGSAWAHVEVGAKPARALAVNAVVGFSAEAESSSAGIASIRVVLPRGIGPADVSYVSGPSGWALAATADGYTLSGKALPAHTAAAYKIKVKQLPDARTLAFKTLVTYSDGDVDRWIELPSAGDPNPDHPAPILTLEAAAPGEVTPSPSPTEISLVASATSATTFGAAPPAQAAETSPAVWTAVMAGAAAVVALVFLLVRRRRT
jgi:hypothetical protein